VPRHQTVVQLHPRRRPPGDLPVPVDRIGSAFHRLDDLWTCIERITRDGCWSVLEWKVACTEIAVRVPGVLKSLEDLAGIRADRWPDTDWAVRLSAARNEVERRLLSLSGSMSSFGRDEAATANAVASFDSDFARLARAVDELCSLIAKQHPEAIGEG
jgi:hypothetical protein